MSALVVIGITLVVAGLVAAPFCWKVSKLHEHAAILSQCIAELIGEPDKGRREMIAAQARLDCIENGTWLNG